MNILSLFFFFHSVVIGTYVHDKPNPSASGIIYQSSDGGNTWQDVSDGLPKDFLPQSVFVDRAEIFLGYEKGIFKSSSNCLMPRWEQELLFTESISKFFPGNKGTFCFSYPKGIFQRFAGTGVWIQRLHTVDEKIPMAILETTQGNLLVTSESGIYKSFDQGKNWKQVFKDEMVTTLVQDKDVLLAGTITGLLRSVDDGEHWESVLSENSSTRKIHKIKNGFAVINYPEDSWNKRELFPERVVNKLILSKDKGSTWKRIDESLLSMQFIHTGEKSTYGDRTINDVEQVGEFLFCSLDNCVFRSIDEGKTWQKVLQQKSKNKFEFAVSGQKIYAVLVFSGC